MILFLLVFNMRDAFSSCPGRLNLDYVIFVYRLNSQVPVYIVNGSLSACPPVILQEFSHAALAATSSPLGVIGGSLTGHGVATVIDVLGGSLLGTFLSEMVECPTQRTLILSLQQ
ncbi:hypothetical protein POTOM_004323 [Populus tomentosa]|uniref:GDT1 family protein n=1 Tax=Populus tomentosa TaxID=118781 RepID=A0A8X8AK04_POPTO|nr:hypothetical protein POTOM_004323 [Populus tomentosa]